MYLRSQYFGAEKRISAIRRKIGIPAVCSVLHRLKSDTTGGLGAEVGQGIGTAIKAHGCLAQMDTGPPAVNSGAQHAVWGGSGGYASSPQVSL